MLAYSIGIASILYARLPQGVTLAAAVGDSYDPAHDPFQTQMQEEASTTSDYLYRESLPLGFGDWSWKTTVNWRSPERAFEGARSLYAMFTEPGASVRADSPKAIDLSAYASLSIAVYPEAASDVYLELYDLAGNSLGQQSLAWYAAGGAFVPGAWNVLTIPLVNLTAVSPDAASARKISGFALISTQAGVVFFDSIRLNKFVVSHARWAAGDSAATSSEAMP